MLVMIIQWGLWYHCDMIGWYYCHILVTKMEKLYLWVARDMCVGVCVGNFSYTLAWIFGSSIGYSPTSGR